MGSKRIVVIDDCKLTLTMTRDILEEAGFDVVTAETGIEANAYIYGTSPPDLILIDLVMPMLHGDRKVRLLKAGESSRSIPVILISTRPEAELRELSRISGADGYLQKPVNKVSLLELVHRYV